MEENVNNKLAYLVVFVVLFSAIVLGLSTFKDAYSFYTAIVSTGVQTVAASGRCGDVDGDGDVDNDDAIYLLRYTLFPSQYPLAYNGNTADVYHDNVITEKDATTLDHILNGYYTTCPVEPSNVKFAMFVTGPEFRSKMVTIAGGNSTNITDIIRVQDDPGSTIIGVNNTLVNTTNSEVPIRMWYSTNKIYYYSEAPTIYLNPNSNQMFGNPNWSDSYFQKIVNINTYGWDTSKVNSMYAMFSTLGNLNYATTTIDSWDVRNVTNMSNTFSYSGTNSVLNLGNWNTHNVTDMSSMFTASKFNSINMSNFNTIKVENMYRMFSTTYNLVEFNSSNIPNFKTNNVITMGAMFDMTGAKIINVSTFNTNNVLDMSYMFDGSTNLYSLNVSTFDTRRVTNMYGMFYATINLSSLNIASWNTHKVSNMAWMFKDSRRMLDLNMSSFNMVSAINMSSMFENTRNLQILRMDNWNSYNVTNIANIFYNTPNLVTLSAPNWNLRNVTGTGLYNMFNTSNNLYSVNLSNWNTSNATNANSLFAVKTNLYTLNLYNWNSHNITTMANLVYNVSNLGSLNVTNIKTNNVLCLFYAFSNTNVTTMDVQNWNVNKVNNFWGTFAINPKLTTLNVSNWNTANASRMGYMFYYTPKLTTLDVSNFKTNYVSTTFAMFNVTGASVINVSNWNTSSLGNIDQMFRNTSNLYYVNMRHWDFSKISTMKYAFQDAKNLRWVDFALTNWTNTSLTNANTINLFVNTTNLNYLVSPRSIRSGLQVNLNRSMYYLKAPSYVYLYTTTYWNSTTQTRSYYCSSSSNTYCYVGNSVS